METFLKFSVSGEGRVVDVRKARRKTFQDSFLLAQKIGVKAAGMRYGGEKLLPMGNCISLVINA